MEFLSSTIIISCITLFILLKYMIPQLLNNNHTFGRNDIYIYIFKIFTEILKYMYSVNIV